MIAPLLMAASLSLSVQTAPAAPSGATCRDALSAGATGATAELCMAEEQRRQADALPHKSPQRAKLFTTAVQHYRESARLSAGDDAKARVLVTLLGLFEITRLNDPEQMEGVLRELIELQPAEVNHLFRLAQLQEERGFLDTAESTLLAVRQQHGEEIEAYRKLAQFYARRATALHRAGQAEKPATENSNPGEPDQDGVYRVGGSLQPPRRMDNPVYPPEAQAAGVKGVVQAEVVIDESGAVSDVKIVRSIPMLDEAALETVRNWRFAPTIVDGNPVPVRMTVSVNFAQ